MALRTHAEPNGHKIDQIPAFSAATTAAKPRLRNNHIKSSSLSSMPAKSGSSNCSNSTR